MSTTGLWLSRRSIRRSAGLSSIELHNNVRKEFPFISVSVRDVQRRIPAPVVPPERVEVSNAGD
jgi:hypothetical protein